MNIAIDGRLLNEKITGINRFLWNVIKILPQFDNQNKYSLFTYYDVKYEDPFYSFNYVRRLKLPRQLIEHFWLNFVLPKHLKKNNIKLFFTPYILVPLKRGSYKNVIVIHDVMTKVCEEFFTSYYKRYMDFIVPLAINKSDAIVTVSESARQDIIKYYNVSSEKVHYMHLWTDEKFQIIKMNENQKKNVLTKYGLPDRYILYVGAIEKRKNILGILKISDILQSRGININIVLAGTKGFGYDELEVEINKRSDKVLYLNYVEEKDLPLIYNLADIFIFPSYYEGFGLPVLEAMKCGLPVLAGKNSSLIEVVGDGGLLFDSEDSSSFADNIILLISDKDFYNSMKNRAIRQAEKFNQKNEMPKLVNLFNSLV